MLSHNLLGKKDWSKRFRPWKVILEEKSGTKEEATQREKWLKSGTGRKSIKALPD
jgi:predicted GIY-YIG superfamily endonuclease